MAAAKHTNKIKQQKHHH